MDSGAPTAADRPAFEITASMIEAGVEELREFRLGDDLPYLAEQVFMAMAFRASPPLLR